MASNTPLRRYKQNTHGGGIRDPLVMAWPRASPPRANCATSSCHACDLDADPARGDRHQAAQGNQRRRADADRGRPALRARRRGPSRAVKRSRNISRCSAIAAWWQDGWKAVCFHPPGTPFDHDKWELFISRGFFGGRRSRRASEPERLKAMIKLWWSEAEKHNVLPLDDRFAPRFADNAALPRRAQALHLPRRHGPLPTDVAPDVRSRSYTIEADVEIDGPAPRAC
jgi:arylsulfatase A-like enzyme